MALKKPNPTENKSFEPAEGEGEAQSTVVDKEKTAAPAPSPAPAPAPAAEPSNERYLAERPANAVANKGAAIEAAKAFKAEVSAMQGAADFSYGTHRVFKAKDGDIKEMKGDKLKLGRWVKVRMLAWDRHYEVSPGEESESSSGFVAYSKDGVTIDNVIGEEQRSWEGKPVADYVAYLQKEEQFDKAGKREFIDVQAAVLDCEEEKDFHEIVQITLSASSIPAFRKYQSDLEARAKCVQMGLPGYTLPEDPFTFYFIREAAEKGKMTWTKLRIATALPAKF